MSEQSERSPIQLQDMTLDKEAGQKLEVQKLQELPQQQQREDDHEEEEEEHTSTSLKASHAITEQTREEQPREQEEKKEDDEDKEVGNITVSPPSETPFKQSERFPIQELPQQQQTEEDTATSLNVSHAGEQTIEEQPKEPEQGQEEGKEQEAQNLQELPQQQQREEEEDTATSHYNASNAREQEQGQEDVDISSTTLPLMMKMKMNKWRSSPVTPAKRPAQKSDLKDEDCQGIKKKTRTKVTCDKPPTTFLECVLTDVDYEIGFLNCIIEYYHNNARYPYYDYIAVDDFIKNWLEVDATQRQLIDVILKLRKKYKETLAKMGVAKKFSDPLHQRAFNLAQRIWTNSGFKEDWKNLKKSRFIASPFP
ncbi:myb-like protein V [Quercus lobata]|uniref:Glabrous enhancer-binding protein-like DBD domain-containing protein n=1 Tax=Quercus lobata TaxID=97700 RepID=A0A7N2M9I6_QUELO|nr:myb-like protein V [Quercus lobata]